VELIEEAQQPEKIAFQWRKGENIGQLEILKETYFEGGQSTLYFESGRHIEERYKDEYLYQLRKGETSMPMSMMEGNSSIIGDLPSEVTEAKIVETKPKESPLFTLLEKQSTKNITDFTITFKLPFPTKSVYDLLRDSFDDDIDKALLDFVLKKIDQNKIKEEITNSINLKISEYAN
jgi:hypothetical protein